MIKNAFAIPDELRSLKQWILWRYEDKGSKKPTKVPYSIRNYMADVTKPSDWATFDEAFNIFQFGGYDGIGLVFTDNDPYTFIDLDDCSKLANGEPNPNVTSDLKRQHDVFKEFDSYAEISPSGNGLHIIVKGKIPQGRRRSFIEIYSSQRYATMTGNVYHNKMIADRQEILTLLFNQMGGSPKLTSYSGNEPETQTDEKIIEAATNASNGDKFRHLFSGDWSQYYQSQSEGDFALIDIIAFYTQNRNQIARIFRKSGLGQRDKANRKDYLDWMINKSFDRILPSIDFDGFRIALEEKIHANKSNSIIYDTDNGSSINDGSAIYHDVQNGPVAQRSEPIAHNGLVVGSNPTGTTILPPPGLVGELARFIYEAAPRPVPEIALAAAIGLMAGVCGRAYNVSGTGLNQYVLLLANTGTGKEAMASGIDKVVNAVSMQVPVASEFIGPSEIASGQALVKYLSNKSQSFVSILGEFGLRLQAMSSIHANGAEKTLKRMLLNLYNKSGHGQVERPSIYADNEKNTNLISSPAFSILGESTPETFYSALTEEMIAEGLLPRFMLIEYKGKRPEFNPNHITSQPPLFLIDKVATLMANAKTIMANRRVTNIELDDEAKKIVEAFDKLADGKINSTDSEVTRQLWNRAHIKVLKIAGLIAVGVNPFNPLIIKDYVLWAKGMVENDIRALSAKFESGEVGRNSDEIKQSTDMYRIIKDYIIKDWDKIKSYCTEQRMHSEKVIPYYYINKRLSNVVSFKKDRLGANVAIKKTIQVLIDGGVLVEAPRKQLIDKYGTTQKAYLVANVSEFI